MTPLDRARRAVGELVSAYRDARGETEREDVARVIATLTPNGGRSLADLADAALRTARENS